MKLACYDYEIKFRRTGKHCNPDMCSRFPLAEEPGNSMEALPGLKVFSLYGYELDEKVLLNSALIAKFTRKSYRGCISIHIIDHGWPDNNGHGLSDQLGHSTPQGTEGRCPSFRGTEAVKDSDVRDSKKDLVAYHQRRHEITVEQVCLLWGSRVLIPEKLRQSTQYAGTVALYSSGNLQY